MARVFASCLSLLALGLIGTVKAAVTVNSTILVLARDTDSIFAGTTVFEGYGIPYRVIDLSKGTLLPALNSTPDAGNFGGIVTVSSQAYKSTDDWSNLLKERWAQIYAYQANFGVRLVRLNSYPSLEFGVVPTDATQLFCSDALTKITNTTGFATANLKADAIFNSSEICRYPATIKNTTNTFEVTRFAKSGTAPEGSAAVVNFFPNREQMVWFHQFAPDWSPTSVLLSHAWIHWMTRGLYLGFRRVYFNTQVDDVFLQTGLYPDYKKNFRVVPADLQEHISWMVDINKRLPAGSNYKVELGHNGNGNIEFAVDKDYDNRRAKCSPQNGVEYSEQPDGPLEIIKPIGSGKDIWPRRMRDYSWSLDCLTLDPLAVWLFDKTNADKYFHITHTFTHEDETNATYADVVKEITWNQKWLAQAGLDTSINFSPNGIIPPGITGLHNGDALRAWTENGIKYAVGDNSRPVLMKVPDRKSDWWPITTDVEHNGYVGTIIIGRYASSIYYNCDLPTCVNDEWHATSKGVGDFNAQLKYEQNTNVRNLLALHWDPYMFHQANMRVSDVNETTINGVKKRYSLLMAWTETMMTEVTRLTDWPIVTLKHDDIVNAWINRKARDLCYPAVQYTLSDDRKSMTGANVNAADAQCSTPIPVTFPGAVKAATSATKEQVGNDPVTLWVSTGGKTQSYQLNNAVKLHSG